MEAWFAKYAENSLLDSKQFRTALQNLPVPWAIESKALFKAIEVVFDCYQGLTAEQIGLVVFMNAAVDLDYEEAAALAQVHKCL